MTAEATSVGEPVIDVTELTRRFDSMTALDSVSLSMPRGAVYGLVGANGAGKTTLISLVAGTALATEGTVEVLGHDVVRDYRLTRRAVGLVGCPARTPTSLEGRSQGARVFR